MLKGEPWFVTADVCRTLDVYVYKGKVNITMATKKLSSDEAQFNRIELTPDAPRTAVVPPTSFGASRSEKGPDVHTCSSPSPACTSSSCDPTSRRPARSRIG